MKTVIFYFLDFSEQNIVDFYLEFYSYLLDLSSHLQFSFYDWEFVFFPSHLEKLIQLKKFYFSTLNGDSKLYSVIKEKIKKLLKKHSIEFTEEIKTFSK